MTTRDLFGLFVRIFGFLVFFYGLRYLVAIWVVSDISAFNAMPTGMRPSGGNRYIGSLLVAVAGAAVFYFADAITDFAYRPRREKLPPPPKAEREWPE